MAEERFEPREINFRQWLPWTQLFRGFWVALDHKKLLLAAAGILVMAIGWWFLASVSFNIRKAPEWGNGDYGNDEHWPEFQEARRQWNLFYEAAGPRPEMEDANDLAKSADEFNVMFQEFPKITAELGQGKSPDQIKHELGAAIERGKLAELAKSGTETAKEEIDAGRRAQIAMKWFERRPKPYGKLRTLPWFEPRGPNPFLLVSGRAGQQDTQGAAHTVPWESGHFLDWFIRDQVPVLIEPLVKFLRPVFYLLNPNAGFKDRLYFLLVIIWTVATWAVFGGAITRIAAVEVARNEKIGLGEAFRYTLTRWRSYLFASFAPLLGIAVFVILLMLFGLFNLIPIFAEFWDGILWGVVLGLGLIMAIVLIGLVGWPMIHATLGAEGSDSFDALSRCYSYVLQKPWSYLWNVIVALVYGAIVVFFVGLMGSLMVYLGKWGVSQNPFNGVTNRDPSYLFVYAPTSFGWRDLLLQGSTVAGTSGVPTDQAVQDYVNNNFRGWNYIGAFLVACWLYLVFLMIVGFGYSYFWSASTIIYLLMRRKVDDTELDEVYLEEEDTEEPYSAPSTTASSVAQAGQAAGVPLQMVESPSLRPSGAPAAPSGSATSSAETSSPNPGDGNVPSGGSASS